jgi:uncharacterized protein YndB with AHSA1/START domain
MKTLMATKTETNADRELKITRIINAPRDLVFEVWTDPEHIRHWWGPSGFTNTISKMDFRNGGEWEFVMHGPDGTDYKNINIFDEIIRPESIKYTHITGPKFKVHVTFESQGQKTLLTMTLQFESIEQKNSTIKQFKADEGLKENIARLEEYLKVNIRGRELIIQRKLNAPRELVFKVWTDPDHVVKWWGPNGFTNTNIEMNVKEGGVWRYIMHAPDGTNFPNRITFIQVLKPERLIYWHGSDEDNDPNAFHVTITFEANDNQTNLTMRSVFKSAAALEEVRKFGAVEGGNQSLQRLESHLQQMQSK